MPGVLPENTWMSEEIVSGGQPPGIAIDERHLVTTDVESLHLRDLATYDYTSSKSYIGGSLTAPRSTGRFQPTSKRAKSQTEFGICSKDQ